MFATFVTAAMQQLTATLPADKVHMKERLARAAIGNALLQQLTP
jgi:hypothetical protein